ncbi:MAG: hypothetical protein U9R27_03385, partial [Campylobacterota bacterium]|nr:hypothetical protein [Campylobacterota bacterium]
MKFEYDENQSHINKEKHGIDFVNAQNLWQDENALISSIQTLYYRATCKLKSSPQANPPHPHLLYFKKSKTTPLAAKPLHEP